MANDDEKMVRLRYDSSESGWAVDLGDGTYRLANVPYCNGLNIDDVVTVKTGSDRLMQVDKVLTRSFVAKDAIFYDTVEQFHAITRDLRERGCKSEGVAGPHGGRRGVMVVASPEGVDALAVARAHGVVNPDEDGPAPHVH